MNNVEFEDRLLQAFDMLLQQQAGEVDDGPYVEFMAWDLPAQDRPAFVIPEFGPVTVTASLGDVSEIPGFESLHPTLDMAKGVMLRFHVGGAEIAQVDFVVLSLATLSLEELACENDGIHHWMSRITDDSDMRLTKQAQAAWPVHRGELPEHICMVTYLSIAPIFQSSALLSHLIDTVKWSTDLIDPEGIVRWCWIFQVPTPEQVQFSDVHAFHRESDASLLWYQAALKELGAVLAGQVNHAFMTGHPPHYCPHHPNLFLLPHVQAKRKRIRA